MTDLPPTFPPDEELVRQTLESQDAFARLVERYYRMVFAIALARVKSRETAEEVAQETFLRAYLHLDRLQKPDQLASWIGSIARNLAESWRISDQTRSRLAAMVPLDEEAGAIADIRTSSPRAELISREEERLVREALEKLPAPEREVVFLHFLEGLTKSDIARRIGVYPSTVARQLESALARLRQDLGGLLRPEAVSATAGPSRRGAGRAALVIAALAALPEAARARIRATGLEGSGPAGTVPVAPLPGMTVPYLSSGGHLMLGIKVLAATALVVGIAGGVYRSSSSPPGSSAATPPGGTASSAQPQWTGSNVAVTLPSATVAESELSGAAAQPPAPPPDSPTPLVLGQATPAVPRVQSVPSAAIAPRAAAPGTTTSVQRVPLPAAHGEAAVIDGALREKVSRAKNDMRSLGTGIETYFVDNNAYPVSDTNGNVRKPAPEEPRLPSFQSHSLTTPISYISGHFEDPFSASGQPFVYHSVNPPRGSGKPGWILLSAGPDGRFDLDPTIYSPEGNQPQDQILRNAWDPTNGTLSRGDIWRVKQ